MSNKISKILAYSFILLLGMVALLTLSILGVEVAGRNIPQMDLIMDYITALAWAIVLEISILFWPVPTQHKHFLLMIWLAKIFMTLGVMLFYEYNYVLDAYYYFYSSKMGEFAWQDFQFGAGTINVVNLVRLHQYFIADSYHTLKVTTAMIGMVSIYIFYRAAIIFLKNDDFRILYAIALYPSILFWSSILGKDPIMLLGIALYVYGVVGWQLSSGKWQYLYLLWGTLGVWIASFMRLWYAPILLAPLAVFFIIGAKNFFAKILLVGIVASAFLVSFSMFAERFSIETGQDLVLTTDKISSSWTHGGSAQEIKGGLSSMGDMLAFIPIGSFTALFRPLPGEVLNPFGLLAGIEDIILLSLLAVAIKRTRWAELKEPLILWAIITIMAWATMYGFASYQNLGSAVRYRLQILPILLGVLFYLSRHRQFMPSKKVSVNNKRV
ncbi:MAG: hypothetical protein BWK78_00795 [Thiotrichaceae bacterium IS1]|nr:MAG: hypothetical protein BWK78_00795 [Thiotrichaceae bacterium IS1]